MTRFVRRPSRRLVLVVALSCAAMALSSCATTSTGAFSIRFRNDLASPVHLYQCVGLQVSCIQTTGGVRMLPGQTAVGTARVKVPNPWLVQRDGSGQVSCINLNFDAAPATVPLVQLSSATPGPCKKS